MNSLSPRLRSPSGSRENPSTGAEARTRGRRGAIPPEDEFQGQEKPTEELVAAARRGLREIMDFAKLELEVEVSEGEGQLEIELSGPDRARLVEDRGNLLLAIQHLLPRLIRGYTGSARFRAAWTRRNFHASREAELEKLAEEAAQEVVIVSGPGLCRR